MDRYRPTAADAPKTACRVGTPRASALRSPLADRARRARAPVLLLRTERLVIRLRVGSLVFSSASCCCSSATARSMPGSTTPIWRSRSANASGPVGVAMSSASAMCKPATVATRPGRASPRAAALRLARCRRRHRSSRGRDPRPPVRRTRGSRGRDRAAAAELAHEESRALARLVATSLAQQQLHLEQPELRVAGIVLLRAAKRRPCRPGLAAIHQDAGEALVSGRAQRRSRRSRADTLEQRGLAALGVAPCVEALQRRSSAAAARLSSC